MSNNINNNVSFTALTRVSYGKGFNPKKCVEDARAAYNLLESNPMQSLFEKYDGTAFFKLSKGPKYKAHVYIGLKPIEAETEKVQNPVKSFFTNLFKKSKENTDKSVIYDISGSEWTDPKQASSDLAREIKNKTSYALEQDVNKLFERKQKEVDAKLQYQRELRELNQKIDEAMKK